MALSMEHWNGNQVVAIDTETSGLDPYRNEILQVAMLALDSNFCVREDVKPFMVYLKPQSPETIEAAALRVNGLKVDYLNQHGLDPIQSIEALEAWMDTLKLGYTAKGNYRCKVIPLGHNYAFDRPFIQKWLGPLQYEEWFHYHYRDSMLTAAYINDQCAMQAEDVPFQHISLNAVCKKLKIPTDGAHDALQDAFHTAMAYHRMTRRVGFVI